MAKRLCQETLKQSRFLFVCFYDKSNPDFILCTSSKPGPLTKHSKPATYNIISQSRRTIIGHPFSLSTRLHHLNDGQLSVLHKQYKKYCFFPEKWQQCFSKVCALTLWIPHHRRTTNKTKTVSVLLKCQCTVNCHQPKYEETEVQRQEFKTDFSQLFKVCSYNLRQASRIC